MPDTDFHRDIWRKNWLNSTAIFFRDFLEVVLAISGSIYRFVNVGICRQQRRPEK